MIVVDPAQRQQLGFDRIALTTQRVKRLRVRNAPTKFMKNLGYHKGYKLYDKESYLFDKLKGKKYLK